MTAGRRPAEPVTSDQGPEGTWPAVTVAEKHDKTCGTAVSMRAGPGRTFLVTDHWSLHGLRPCCASPAWWPLRGAQNPIPFRTRPLNPSAPMVLSLKAWESRSLPGPPSTETQTHTRTILLPPAPRSRAAGRPRSAAARGSRRHRDRRLQQTGPATQ